MFYLFVFVRPRFCSERQNTCHFPANKSSPIYNNIVICETDSQITYKCRETPNGWKLISHLQEPPRNVCYLDVTDVNILIHT